MSNFTTDLHVTPTPVDGYWKLTKSLVYWTFLKPPNYNSIERFPFIRRDLDRIFITVPSTYETDFATTPRCIWWLIPPWGKYGKAAIIHDLLYEYRIGTRLWADKVFYEAMKVCGVPFWKRKLIYRFVRWFGYRGYWTPSEYDDPKQVRLQQSVHNYRGWR